MITMRRSERVEIDNNVFYLNEEGEYHRDSGPACEYSSGDKEWYLQGKLDRKDGPARSLVDGTKEWFREGELHRGDGPAIQRSDGSEEWWCCGHRVPDICRTLHVQMCQQLEYQVVKSLAEKILIPMQSQPGDLSSNLGEELLSELGDKKVVK